VAQALAAEGCTLDIASRSRPALEAARDKIVALAPQAQVRVHQADLAVVADQLRLARDCIGADILINNAGANAACSLEDTSDALWRESWELKVFGYINLSAEFYRAMKQRRDGVIVNIIGSAGERHNARYIIGTTGNAALMAFTRSAGSAAPDFGVRIVGVNPGYTVTDRAVDQLRAFSEKKFGTPDRWRDIEREMNFPFGRMARPEEVAAMVAFVASPRASYVSGTIVTVDGGATHRN
jgi:NAD(P)-dependent dehydrogenase (short-subunit alcohol dehydrogenase family)